MPIRMAPRRLGATSGGRLAQQGDGDRSGKVADPFYVSAEWKAFRKHLIGERGWRCEDPKCATPRGPWRQIYADHIVEIADGGAKLDRVNIMLRCGYCHGRKTRDEKAARVRLFDPLGAICRGG